MLELLAVVSFYNFAFYFGVFILALVVLFGAWRSTYVPGLQNITVVVLQHPSGRQTVERFTSTRRTSTTEEEVGLQDEVYEEITLTADDDDDVDDEDDDQNDEDSGVEIAILETSSPDQLQYNVSNVSQNSGSSGGLIAEETESGTAMENSPSSSSSNAFHPNNSLDSLVNSASSVKSDGAVGLSSDASAESCSIAVSAEWSSPQSSEASGELVLNKTKIPDKKNLDSEDTKPSENESNNIQTDCSAVPLSATEQEESAGHSDSVPALSISTSKSPVEPELPPECIGDNESNIKKASTENEVAEEESRPLGSIRIRLKYLDERQKTVFEQLTQNLIGFKRKHFNLELAEHRVIRLIFNGRLLKPDSSTLQECGLFDNCVVHCHVSQPKPPPPPSQQPAGEEAAGGSAVHQQQRRRGGRRRWLHFLWHASVPDALHDDDANEGLDLSNYMSALLWLVVAGLWFMRFKHSYMFSTFSTFMLLFLTVLLVVPHYIFSVDVQLSVNLDGNTMRNLGIDRVVVLERLRGRRGSFARRGRIEDDGSGLRRRIAANTNDTDINSGSVAASAPGEGSTLNSVTDSGNGGSGTASGVALESS